MASVGGKFVRHGPIIAESGGLRQALVDNSRRTYNNLVEDKRIKAGSKSR